MRSVRNILATMLLAATAVIAASPSRAPASSPASSPGSVPASSPAESRPAAPPARADRLEPGPAALQDIGIDEKTSTTVPLDLEFTDAAGQPVRLRQFFGRGKPVVLQLSYFDCPMLCGLVSNGLISSLNDLSFTIGKEFELINLSFDPNETHRLAKLKKTSFLAAYNRPAGAESWNFLTGSPDSIKAITDAVGFRYKWVESSRQFSHPAALVLLTPDGKVSRYLYGVKYEPRTLRLSLVEASEGKVGSTVDKFLLACFHYDGYAGKYTPTAMGIMRVGGVLMVIGVASTLGTLIWREKRRGHATKNPTPEATA